MSFQRRPPHSAPTCPWCDHPLIPCDGSQQARLCCPTGDPVEYRARGGRWYFHGRLLGLEEPMPEPPEPSVSAEPSAPAARRGSVASTAPTTAEPTSGVPAAADELDVFRQLAETLLGDSNEPDDDDPVPPA